MLISFSIENFLSVKERQELSLVPSAFYKEALQSLLQCAAVPGGRLLPSVVIYGPNASGKTNLVLALRFLQTAVRNSHAKGSPDGGVERDAFALSKKTAELPTTVEIQFVLNGVRYQYGFSANSKAFLEEWLYFFPRERRQMLFERNKSGVRFGRALKGQNKVISDLMRDNSLFISAAAQNGHEQLSSIFAYVSSFDFDATLNAEPLLAEKEDLDQRVIDFLQKIGTGVVGYRSKKFELDAKGAAMFSEFRALLARFLEKPVDELPITQGDESFRLELAHQGDQAEPVYLSLGMESHGTRRLIVLLDSVFRAIDRGNLLVVDELDASLHTQIGDAILSLFSDPQTNKNGAQLLATTHDTNLMASSHLRRDQIWFTEKDHEGATHLFPLSDIRTRNTDNIERGYLQGRYGAIPFSGSFNALLRANN